MLLFTFIWGANFILAEVALLEMEPISFSVSRFAVGGIAMLVVLYGHVVRVARSHHGKVTFFPRLQRREWPRLLLVAVLGATLAPWLGIEGLSLTDGARASLWLALGPIVSTVLGWVFRTERLGAAGYLGVVLVCIGTVALAVDGLSSEQQYWVGDLILFVALLLAVAELHLIKPLAARYGAVSVTALRTSIGGLCYLLIASPALVQEPWFSFTGWTWFAILFGGAVGVGVGQWVKVRALETIGPTRVVFYGNLVPVAAFAIAWFVLSDRPSTLEWVAAFFIIAGAVCLHVLDVRNRRQTSADSGVMG